MNSEAYCGILCCQEDSCLPVEVRTLVLSKPSMHCVFTGSFLVPEILPTSPF